MKCLVVLPSYNERDNIAAITRRILKLGHHVCVVDDNSPDGTAQEIRNLLTSLPPEQQSQIHLIVRSKKDGRGGAVREGLAWGLKDSSFTVFVEMDCDFSHSPDALAEGLKLIGSKCDVAIGARYPDGVIEGWPRRRRIFSFLANSLARTVIDPKIADYTNGFRFYSRRAAEFLLSRPQRFKGYIYLSETISYLLLGGFKIVGFPIHFVNRERGVSNTNLREITAALRGILSIAREFHAAKRSVDSKKGL